MSLLCIMNVLFKDFINTIDRSKLRGIERQMHLCAAECCSDGTAQVEDVHRCIEKCQVRYKHEGRARVGVATQCYSVFPSVITAKLIYWEVLFQEKTLSFFSFSVLH